MLSVFCFGKNHMPDQPNLAQPPTFPDIPDIPPMPATDTPPLDIPPMIIDSSSPKKNKGKIIATILGILLLVGAVGAGVVLVGQKQLFEQKAGGPACNNDPETASECRGRSPGYIVDACWAGYGNDNPDDDKSLQCQETTNGWCAAMEIDTPGSCGGGGGGGGGNPTSGTCQNGNPFNNQCVVIYCPNGDTNGDGACEVPDTGAWYGQRHTCGTVSFGANECGQIDPVDGNGAYCQLDGWNYNIKLNNCSGTPTPPPPDEPTAQCLDVKAYDTGWNQLSADQLKALKAGDEVRFTVSGTPANKIDKAKFKINGVDRPETTDKKPGSDEYYDKYTIPAGVTSFTIKAKLHHKTLGWF